MRAMYLSLNEQKGPPSNVLKDVGPNHQHEKIMRLNSRCKMDPDPGTTSGKNKAWLLARHNFPKKPDKTQKLHI